MGLHKNIETPELMWQLFQEYREQVKAHPRHTHVLAQKTAAMVKQPLEVPLTIEGFYEYMAEQGILVSGKDYFSNKEDRYALFATICYRIKTVIRKDQIEGGMVGQFNPSITQRLNGLAENMNNRLTDSEGNDRVFRVTLNINPDNVSNDIGFE